MKSGKVLTALGMVLTVNTMSSSENFNRLQKPPTDSKPQPQILFPRGRIVHQQQTFFTKKENSFPIIPKPLPKEEHIPFLLGSLGCLNWLFDKLKK